MATWIRERGGEEPSLAEVSRRVRRLRRRRALVRLAAFALLATIATIAYLQSSHAVRHVWAPLVERSTHGQLSIDDGDLSLLGNFELTGVRWGSAESAVQLSADVVRVHAAPGSFLRLAFGSMLGAATSRNEPSAQSDSSGEMQAGFEGSGEPRGGGTVIPLAIHWVVIEGLEVKGVGEEGLNFNFEQARFEATRLEPGAEGRLRLRGIATVYPRDADRRRRGALTLDLKLTQSPDGSSLQWSGDARGTIENRMTRQGEAPARPFRLDAQWQGAVSSTRQVRSAVMISGSNASGARGSLDADVLWQPGRPGLPRRLEVKIDLADAGPDLLNPLAGLFGTTQLETGLLGGAISVGQSGESINFDVSLTGQELSFRTGPDGGATPASNLTLLSTGHFDRSTGAFSITQADLRMTRSDRSVVALTLDSTLTLSDRAENDLDRREPDHGDPAKLRLVLDGLHVDEVRSWLALIGRDELDSLDDGRISGSVDLLADGAGTKIDFSGAVEVTELLIRSGRDETARPKLGLDGSFEGSVEALDRVVLSAAAFDLSGPEKSLASASASGAWELNERAGQVQVDLKADDSALLLRSLGLGFSSNLDGGKLTAAVSLSSGTNQPGFEIAATGRMTDLIVTLDGGRRLRQSFTTEGRYRIDPDLATLELADARLTLLDDADQEAGTLTAWGTWPIARTDRDAKPGGRGRLQVEARRVDARPWLDLIGLPDAAAAEGAIFEADWTLSVDTVGDRLIVDGEERLGPVRLARGDSGAGPAADPIWWTIKNQAEKIGDRIENISVSLVGRGPEGDIDNLLFEGSATLGERPSFQLTGLVHSLDLEPYLGWWAAPESVVPSEEKRTGPMPASEGGDSPASGPEPFPVDLELDLKIANLRWRDIEFSDGSVRIVSNASAFHIEARSPNVNGAAANGSYDLGFGGPERTLSWRLDADGFDAAAVLGSINPKLIGKVEGRGAVLSQGTALGRGDDLKRRLEGSIAFNLTEGRLGQSGLMAFIAEKTHIAQFNEMAFNEFSGDVALRDGGATLDEVWVRGATAALKVGGRIEFGGSYDLEFIPRISTRLANKITDNRFASILLAPTDGFTEFPFAVTATGTFDSPRYGVRAQLPEPLERVGHALNGTLRDLLKKSRDALPLDLLRRD